MKFITNIDKDRYQEFTFNHDKSHFLQSYEWGDFCLHAKGQIPKYVGMEDDDGNLVASALILLKNIALGYSYGYSPRGFLIDYNNKEYIRSFTDYLKEYMHDNKIIYIKFDPDLKYQDIDSDANKIEGGFNNYELYNYMLSLGYIHKGFNRLYEGNQPRYTIRIDLQRPWEDIESGMSKSLLKSVKRSYNYDLIIDNEVNIDEFYRLMQKNSAKDGFNARTLDYFKAFSDSMSKDTMKYFNASICPKKIVSKEEKELAELKQELGKNKKKEADIKNKIAKLEKDIAVFKSIKEDKVMVCSLICTYTHNRAWSLYIGSDDLANQTFAVTRCYYEAIKSAYDNGYVFFDLFGTTGDPHTTYKNLANLHDFKRKFGDEYIEFIGEFDLVNNKVLYNILPILLKVYRKIKGYK